ncbi:hypothetical protein FKM82_000799 [Ascaphus truei]
MVQLHQNTRQIFAYRQRGIRHHSNQSQSTSNLMIIQKKALFKWLHTLKQQATSPLHPLRVSHFNSASSWSGGDDFRTQHIK